MVCFEFLPSRRFERAASVPANLECSDVLKMLQGRA
jgi:hypothetical protein